MRNSKGQQRVITDALTLSLSNLVGYREESEDWDLFINLHAQRRANTTTYYPGIYDYAQFDFTDNEPQP